MYQNSSFIGRNIKSMGWNNRCMNCKSVGGNSGGSQIHTLGGQNRFLVFSDAARNSQKSPQALKLNFNFN